MIQLGDFDSWQLAYQHNADGTVTLTNGTRTDIIPYIQDKALFHTRAHACGFYSITECGDRAWDHIHSSAEPVIYELGLDGEYALRYSRIDDRINLFSSCDPGIERADYLEWTDNAEQWSERIHRLHFGSLQECGRRAGNHIRTQHTNGQENDDMLKIIGYEDSEWKIYDDSFCNPGDATHLQYSKGIEYLVDPNRDTAGWQWLTFVKGSRQVLDAQLETMNAGGEQKDIDAQMSEYLEDHSQAQALNDLLGLDSLSEVASECFGISSAQEYLSEEHGISGPRDCLSDVYGIGEIYGQISEANFRRSDS